MPFLSRNERTGQPRRARFLHRWQKKFRVLPGQPPRRRPNRALVLRSAGYAIRADGVESGSLFCSALCRPPRLDRLPAGPRRGVERDRRRAPRRVFEQGAEEIQEADCGERGSCSCENQSAADTSIARLTEAPVSGDNLQAGDGLKWSARTRPLVMATEDPTMRSRHRCRSARCPAGCGRGKPRALQAAAAAAFRVRRPSLPPAKPASPRIGRCIVQLYWLQQ